MNKTGVLAAAFCCLLAAGLVWQGVSYGGRADSTEDMPGPMLLYPVTHDIDLKSKTYLEFKWQLVDTATTDYYEFRLYKGYGQTQENLLIKEHLLLSDCPFKLDAAGLMLNQVYTWSLVRVYRDGKKSDKSYASFTMVSK